MTPTALPLRAVALALLVPALAACGSAPTDASEADFCAAYLDTSWRDGVDEGEFVAQEDALRVRAESLGEVGTPADIPDDARRGFEAHLDVLGEVDSGDLDAAEEEGRDAEEEFVERYGDRAEDVEAFWAWADATCRE